MQPLHQALIESDTYTVKNLLKDGVNPSCVDRNNGKSALHYAAEMGNFTYVDLLLDRKASFLKVDKERHTILHSAAMGNLTDLTDILIKNGADVHAVDVSRRQPMHYSVAITKSLFGDGMSVLSMHLAASADARLLWALGAYGRDGGNFVAVSMKKVELALAESADSDAVDSLRNRRALHYAVEKGAPPVVWLLLNRGAVVNRADISGRTALHTAARLENPGQDEEVAASMVETLIEFGADVNAQDEDSLTPLHYAASLGATQLVTILLAHRDANVHAVGGSKRRTPLHYAAYSSNDKGAFETCRILLLNGSNVFGVDTDRHTALDLAIDRNASDVVDLLLGSNLNSQLLWAVGGFGRKKFEKINHDEVVFLLEKGAIADTNDPVDGRAALHIGASVGDKALVNLLLDNEGDVNIRDFNKSTALHSAVGNMDSDMTLLLLARGANIHLADKDSRTVLHIALEMGEVGMASTLLQMGADVNAVDKAGRTALHDTVLTGEVEMVSTLLKNGADVLAVDSDLKIPLHYAVEKEFTEIIPLLLTPSRNAQLLWAVGGYERPEPFEVLRSDVMPILRESSMGGEGVEGADANAVDPLTGATALHYAASIGAEEVVTLLLSKKKVVGEIAEVNAVDREGMAPLHWAAQSGDESLEAARVLADLEGDVHAVDKAGFSPLYYAVEAKATGMVGLMLDKGAEESSIEFEKLLECSMTIRLLWTLGGYAAAESAASAADRGVAQVKALLEEGANVMRVDSSTGRLALHYAVVVNDPAVVRTLAERDLNTIECEDLDGKKPLDLAFEMGHAEVAHVLIGRGALNYHPLMNLKGILAWRELLDNDEFFVNALGGQILFRAPGLTQDDVPELFGLLVGVIDSGMGSDLPGLVRSAVVAPIVTHKEMVSYLKRKERMRCLEESCVGQLKLLQEQQDEVYSQDKLSQVLGSLGEELKFGEDPEKGGKAIVSRQDAVLPKTTGTGLNEAGYMHMLCMLSLVLDDGFHDSLVHVIDSAVAEVTPQPSADGTNIREAPPKDYERMAVLLESAHSKKKRPRPAHNLDVLRASATFTTSEALSHAYHGIRKAFNVVRVKNMYAGRRKGQKAGPWDSAVEEAFGFRCILVNFIFAPSGVTFGKLSKLHGKRGGAWFEYVLKLANIDAQHALSFMGNDEWKTMPVKLVCEVQLVYRPFLDIGKLKSHIYKKIVGVASSRDLSMAFDPNASAKAALGGRAATPLAKQKKGGRIRAFTCGVCGRDNAGEGEELPGQESKEDPDEDLAGSIEIQQELNDWIVELQTNGCSMQEYVENTSLLKKNLIRARRRENMKVPGLCRICSAEKGRALSNRKSLGQEIYDATIAGKTTTVKVLCEHATKAEANWSDGKHLTTALMAASSAGHFEIVRTLCNSGADQELRDAGRYTAKEIGALYAPLHKEPLNFTVNTRDNAKKNEL